MAEADVNAKATAEAVFKWLRPLWLNLPTEARDTLGVKEVVGVVEALMRASGGDAIPREDIETVVCPFMRRMEKLKDLRGRRYAPQRSQEWLDLRKGLLTASNLADALNRGKFSTRANLIKKKAEERHNQTAGESFKCFAMKWGTMFEPMIGRIYTEMNEDIELYEFGLIVHPTLTCFGASPDGITSLGKMVEIKCPLKRAIVKGDVPDYYYLQIQGQLAVCEMEECDYLEVVMEDFANESLYFEAVPADSRHAHGIFVDLDTEILYSPAKLTPKEAYAWLQKTVVELSRMPEATISRIYYWKMKDYNLVSVPFDADLWKTLEPQIAQFWEDVLRVPAEPDALGALGAPVEPAVEPAKPVKTKKRAKKEPPKYTYRDEDEPDLWPTKAKPEDYLWPTKAKPEDDF